MNNFQATINASSLLTPLDWFIFACVLLATYFAIIWNNRRASKSPGEESAIDILLMGRQLTLPLFVGTLVATWYGGIFGVTQIAFEKGVYNFVTQGAFWYLSYLVFAFFLVDRIHAFKAVTLPDLVSKMFGPKSAKLSAFFNFFNVLPIAYCISVGLFLQLIFGGGLFLNTFIGTSLVLIYSLFGGLRSVVISDMVQFFVMCSSVLIVLLLSISTFGHWEFLKTNLPSQHFSILGGENPSTLIIWGFIALSTLVDSNFYQRCFAAKSPDVAKKGILVSTVIWLIFDLCTTFGAMYAKAVIPEADSQYAYLTYAVQLLPPGVRGFFLAGILATILSTLDSYLFVAGSTVSYDLKSENQSFSRTRYRLGTLFCALMAIALSTIFDGQIEKVWKLLGSYSAACLLLPIMVGHIFPGKLNDNSFFTSSIFGVVAITIWEFAPIPQSLLVIDSFYVGLIATGSSILLNFEKKPLKA